MPLAMSGGLKVLFMTYSLRLCRLSYLGARRSTSSLSIQYISSVEIIEDESTRWVPDSGEGLVLISRQRVDLCVNRASTQRPEVLHLQHVIICLNDFRI